jgi:putative ABC transport system substrate-binding protein
MTHVAGQPPQHPGLDRRRFLLTSLASALAAPRAPEAQESAKRHRIGILVGASKSFIARYIETFREELEHRGYREGRNIVIESRFADGNYDRLRGLATDLVRLKLDVIVTEGTPPTRAATDATTTIPIVMTVTGDPVAAGLVTNLARPGGNLTGASFFLPELAMKRLQLLKEAIPGLGRVAVVWNPNNAVHGPVVQRIEAGAKALGIDVQHVQIRGPADFADALVAIGKSRDGLLVIEDATINVCSTQIAKTAVKHRLPAVFGLTQFTEEGGLMAYGPNRPELWRRAAIFVDKILRGAKPGELPIEQAVRFDLVLNARTARALGLTIPPSLLARADQVIE